MVSPLSLHHRPSWPSYQNLPIISHHHHWSRGKGLLDRSVIIFCHLQKALIIDLTCQSCQKMNAFSSKNEMHFPKAECTSTQEPGTIWWRMRLLQLFPASFNQIADSFDESELNKSSRIKKGKFFHCCWLTGKGKAAMVTPEVWVSNWWDIAWAGVENRQS